VRLLPLVADLRGRTLELPIPVAEAFVDFRRPDSTRSARVNRARGAGPFGRRCPVPPVASPEAVAPVRPTFLSEDAPAPVYRELFARAGS
jgi:hypothetical protein